MSTTTYQIEYHTHNRYEAPVTEALFEFLVAPCADESQTVSNVSYKNSLDAELFHHVNPFGFQVTSVRAVKPFTEFEFRMQATVEKKEQSYINHGQLSVAEERRALTDPQLYIDQHWYLELTKYTSIAEEYFEWLLARGEDQFTFNFLYQLNQYVHQLLAFDPDPTDVHTTASEVIELRKGVCQDYTHVFLGIARRNGIPSRYVSGYLNQGGSLVGAAVMHAWAEAYIPGMGWCGFDPTNNLLADKNHIKAAHGVDYSDCSPIKGVLKTAGENHTAYHVTVLPQLMEAAEAMQQ